MQVEKLSNLVSEGDYDLENCKWLLTEKDGQSIPVKMYHKWPVRKPRPYNKMT